jgi:adenylate kinase family enzyme
LGYITILDESNASHDNEEFANSQGIPMNRIAIVGTKDSSVQANTSMQRIAIVGTTASGKTTLARQIAAKLNIPRVELDSLHWQANWIPFPTDVFREKVSRATDGDCWITDGNYSKARDIVWGRADTLIWLAYPLPTILYRLTKRTLHRVITREKLWGTNTERWQNAFLSHDSLYIWVFKTYWRHRREYPELLQQPEYAHLQLIRLNSPRESERWLKTLPV